MPTVNGKRFPYTPAGMKAAAQAAKANGKPMKTTKVVVKKKS